ncbi:MAG: hypothetical protein JSS72_13310 [Armatimonadetes bacterium]|nr:hypothetical protein [Armatimonadota bacterium]
MIALAVWLSVALQGNDRSVVHLREGERWVVMQKTTVRGEGKPVTYIEQVALSVHEVTPEAVTVVQRRNLLGTETEGKFFAAPISASGGGRVTLPLDHFVIGTYLRNPMLMALNGLMDFPSTSREGIKVVPLPITRPKHQEFGFEVTVPGGATSKGTFIVDARGVVVQLDSACRVKNPKSRKMVDVDIHLKAYEAEAS